MGDSSEFDDPPTFDEATTIVGQDSDVGTPSNRYDTVKRLSGFNAVPHAAKHYDVASRLSERALSLLSMSDHGEEREEHRRGPEALDQWVSLNVGGQVFTTTRQTLTGVPNSMLERMFREDGHWRSTLDKNGNVLLDREPRYFAPLLNFLRSGSLVVDPNVDPRGVLNEAHFFQLEPVIDLLEEQIERDILPKVKQYAVVSTLTLYYSGLARTNVKVEGPIRRAKRKELEQLSVWEVLNILGSWGWTLRSSSGKGGDQEKFIFERVLESDLVEQDLSASDSGEDGEEDREIGLRADQLAELQARGR